MFALCLIHIYKNEFVIDSLPILNWKCSQICNVCGFSSELQLVLLYIEAKCGLKRNVAIDKSLQNTTIHFKIVMWRMLSKPVFGTHSMRVSLVLSKCWCKALNSLDAERTTLINIVGTTYHDCETKN